MFVSVASLQPDLKDGPLRLKDLCVLLAPYAVFLNKFPQYLKRVNADLNQTYPTYKQMC